MFTNKKHFSKKIEKSLSPKQRAFLEYLKDLGYSEKDDILCNPHEKNVLVKDSTYDVVRRYVPTFLVLSESTAYEVDTKLSREFLDRAKVELACDGFELSVVSEEDFPFDDYLGHEGFKHDAP